MVCIKCRETLKTVDVFNTKESTNTFRRKKCPGCGKVYYTKEYIIDEEKGRQQFRIKSTKYETKP